MAKAIFSPLTERAVATRKYSSRGGRKITRLIIHHTAGGTNAGNVTYLASNPRKVSSTYVLQTTGALVGIVPEQYRPWTTGSLTADGPAVTVETVNSSGAPDWAVTEAQLETLARLAADLATRYGWGALTRKNVMGHREFASTSCLPQDSTELLTRRGWVRLRDAQVGDEVATAHIDTLGISFAPVLSKVEPREQDYYTARGVSATKDHRMLFSLQRTRTQNKVAEWADVLAHEGRSYLPSAGSYEGEGLPLSHAEISLLAAIQADGHYMRDKDCVYGVEFHLKKTRKIEKILDLLDDLEYEPRVSRSKRGTTKIRVYGQPILEFAESWLESKVFTWKLLDMNPTQAAHFLDAILDFDGCRENRSYSSSVRQNVDVVNAVAALNGVGSRGESGRVYLTGPHRTVGAESAVRRHRKGRSELVSCVTVESGFILVRQSGVTTILGNCPGPYLWPRLDAIIARANEILGNPGTGKPAPAPAPKPKPPASRATKYRVTTRSQRLNGRAGPGTNHPVRMTAARGYVLDIVETRNGWARSTGGWWYSMQYLTKVEAPTVTKYRVTTRSKPLAGRAGPGTNHRQTMRAYKGAILDIVETRNGWARSTGGHWYSMKYLTKVT